MIDPKARVKTALGCVFLLLAAGCSSDSSDPGTSGGSTSGGAPHGSAGTMSGAGQTGGGAAGAGASGIGGATGTGGFSAGGGALGGVAGSPSGGGGDAGGGNGGGATAGGAAGTSGRGGAAGSTGGAGTGGGGMNAGGAPAGGTAGYCPTTAGTPCNIMPVGDSITEGCCTNPGGGYRIELFRQALTNQKNITFVGTLTNGPGTVDGQTFPQRHEGHGGWKIAQIAGVIDSAISSSKPHIVLLKIGTNDINGNDNIANAPTRLANLIDQICKDAPNALLVVSAIVPTTNDGTNNNVRAYNTAIKGKAEAAAAAGKHVVFVDNYQAFTANSNYKTALMADGLHPNSAGYAVLGGSFYGVISSYLPAK
ncbi:MAG TPA: SGNH/GDSL hydrolase family protein [Polyangiaceae bacterium]|nr:SGNH/GDSL hydrolase family protein [Polyangiaceae bacterium]